MQPRLSAGIIAAFSVKAQQENPGLCFGTGSSPQYGCDITDTDFEKQALTHQRKFDIGIG